jgi:hypothetical protein
VFPVFPDFSFFYVHTIRLLFIYHAGLILYFVISSGWGTLSSKSRSIF